MNQLEKREIKENKDQFLYIDRWVDKEYFRAFVYGKNNSQILANSYEEYESLISSGKWFPEKKDVPVLEEVKEEEPKILKIRKSKNGNSDS